MYCNNADKRNDGMGREMQVGFGTQEILVLTPEAGVSTAFPIDRL